MCVLGSVGAEKLALTILAKNFSTPKTKAGG
jgi:hypothetical protein